MNATLTAADASKAEYAISTEAFNRTGFGPVQVRPWPLTTTACSTGVERDDD